MTPPSPQRSRAADPRLDGAILIALLALAALLRLPALATRGTWDSDQGHDVLTLRALFQDGVVPLLGPPTSIGDFHHGAWYYYLLSPAAAITGGDSPLAVVAAIALAGIAAVGVTWWLSRSMASSTAGPLAGTIAGAVAGLAMAVSVSAVEESTFIWNPNLIALTSSVALAGAWRAWSTGRSRWWALAAVGTALTMQCHVLGVALLPIVAALYVADLRRTTDGAARGRLVRSGVGAVVVLVIAYLPLAVHEATRDFSEARAALDYLGGGRESGAPAVPIRLGVVGLRVVSWPLVGLITDGFVAAVVATTAIVAIVAWLWRWTAVRWLGLGLLWSVLFLTVAAPSLASVIPGLPNDHYHAFVDPMVFTLVGIAVAAAATGGSRIALAGAGVGLVALLGWNLVRQPPAVHPDGGFPAAEVAAERIMSVIRSAGIGPDDVVLLRSLPSFKSTESYGYPLVRAGQAATIETPQGAGPGSTTGPPSALVIICDRLFEPALEATCGGPAESTVTPDAGGTSWGSLLDRFEAAPGRIISIYPAR